MDYLINYDGQIDKDKVRQALRDNALADLPEPFSFLGSVPDVPTYVQLFAFPQDDGRHTILKTIQFKDKVRSGFLRPHIRGELRAIECLEGGDARGWLP